MKMELVLSAGNLGGEGDAGAPFRNEDVREWSRVDRVTGMLERARVETGRWRANTEDAEQSYGKMIDSRERNSADGSLVQKARRQVEIFQSQGTGGRSFQVVKASQWSSSRAKDCALDVPIANPSNTQNADEMMNGDTNSLTPRLSLWRTSLDNEVSSDLERLSFLCRKLHDEAMMTTNNLWSLRSAARSPSPLASLENSTHFQELDQQFSDRLSTSSIGERKSNSTEDVSSLLSADDTFARDCKTRRSLQIPSITENGASVEDARTRRRNEFIAERAKRFENAARGNENTEVKRNYISTKSFTSIADNDFVKNDPKHPSKLGQVAKISIQDNVQNSQTVQVGSPVLPRSGRKANNKTVVHLRNATSTDDGEPTRCINVTAIKLESKKNSSESENGHYGLLMDTSSSTAPKEEPAPAPSTANGSKPVKKVEFCKTEIHFAADSGKVNIVETDGKPPPTNKFRRRRRNTSLGAATNGNAQKSNMPLVHFGDTSYEKYIFGGGKLPQEYKKTADAEVANKSYVGPVISDSEPKKDRWDPLEVSREDVASKEICSSKDSDADKVGADHNNKFRGTHTTTVNILGEDSAVVPRAAEGVRAREIQLQFAASNRSLSPLAIGDEDGVVSRTTKITVHLQPSPSISRQPRILQNNPFSNLKSVQLVMSIGQMMSSRNGGNDSLSLERLFSSLYNGDSTLREKSQMSWSLQLKSAECLRNGEVEEEKKEGGERRLENADEVLTDTSSNTYPATNHISHKEIGPLTNKNQMIAKTPENNQVLLKIVTTHKPVLARVENDHNPSTTVKPRLKAQAAEMLDEITTNEDLTEESVTPKVEPEAKDHCDNPSSEIASNGVEAPTYENVFDVVDDDTPVYENFQVLRNGSVTKESIVVQPKKPITHSQEKRQKKVLKVSGEESKKKDRSVKSRSVTPLSTLSSVKSDKNSVHSMERAKASSRTSSRDSSIKRHKDTKFSKDDSPKSTQARRSSSRGQEQKSINAEKNERTLRSKKPVEVVYQTAVYNMKNEKLSKPKPKEIKGPRLLNDLICGSKLKRPSDNKKSIKVAVVSQNTSKRKEMTTAMNR